MSSRPAWPTVEQVPEQPGLSVLSFSVTERNHISTKDKQTNKQTNKQEKELKKSKSGGWGALENSPCFFRRYKNTNTSHMDTFSFTFQKSLHLESDLSSAGKDTEQSHCLAVLTGP